MAAPNSAQGIDASIGAIIDTVQSWSRTQSVSVEILHSNRSMLRDLGAWAEIEKILAHAAENYFNAMLPMVFDTDEIDVEPLKRKILAIAAPFSELYEAGLEARQ